MEDVDGAVDGLAVAVEALEETPVHQDLVAATAGVAGRSAVTGVGPVAGIVLGLAINVR